MSRGSLSLVLAHRMSRLQIIGNTGPRFASVDEVVSEEGNINPPTNFFKGVILKRRRGVNNVSRHHRKPRSLGGKNSRRNISVVQDKLHEAWHLLFDNCNPEGVAHIITTYWIDSEWEMIARRKDRKGGGNGRL